MTTTPELRPTLGLLAELRDRVRFRPKLRLHVNDNGAMYTVMSVSHAKLDDDVVVIPDPDVPTGQGWIEEIPTDRWRQMLGWVGTDRRVHVTDAKLGRITGVLVSLDDREAVVDLGGDDQRYVYWASIEEAT